MLAAMSEEELVHPSGKVLFLLLQLLRVRCSHLFFFTLSFLQPTFLAFFEFFLILTKHSKFHPLKIKLKTGGLWKSFTLALVLVC